MGFDYDTAVKVSCGFGGGMYLGSVCGAVTGGIMAIGLKHGGVSMKPGLETAVVVRQFAERFKAQHKSINCPDLTGVDLSKLDISNPKALLANVEPGAFAKCSEYVKDATTIVADLLKNANA